LTLVNECPVKRRFRPGHSEGRHHRVGHRQRLGDSGSARSLQNGIHQVSYIGAASVDNNMIGKKVLKNLHYDISRKEYLPGRTTHNTAKKARQSIFYRHRKYDHIRPITSVLQPLRTFFLGIEMSCGDKKNVRHSNTKPGE